jgi:orotate phosphoribosyltransferase
MREEEVISLFQDIGVLKKGHFRLSSGRHSGTYLQCAILQQYPNLNSIVMSEIVDKVKQFNPTVIIGAAIGGILASYELARLVGARGIFAERVDGVLKLRRGFDLIANDKVIIVEDVITTAKTTLELIGLLREKGLEPEAIVTIVDRREESVDIGYPVFPIVRIQIKTYLEEECPLCKEGISLEEPGSRRMK